MSQEEVHLRVLRLVEARPEISQRELAEALGVSLGKTNYCLRALIEKGWVKAVNFTNNRNKRAYLYQLTPRGIAGKARAARRFLVRKEEEYKALAREIETLRRESGEA